MGEGKFWERERKREGRGIVREMVGVGKGEKNGVYYWNKTRTEDQSCPLVQSPSSTVVMELCYIIKSHFSPRSTVLSAPSLGSSLKH